MSSEKNLEDLIVAFNDWYKGDPHSKNRDYYANLVTKNNLEGLDESSFKKFFLDFVRQGGKVQTGGNRSINDFARTLDSNYQRFRDFTLLPFKANFDLKKWFKQIDNFKGFGIGIATIYLNRIDANYYTILNNKTINALKKLGYQITTTKNFTNYKKVQNYQDELIDKYPQLENYYKTDSLNHFIIAVQKGNFLTAVYQQSSSTDDTVEQASIDFDVQDDENLTDVYDQIKSSENSNSERITIKGKTYKRNNYLYALIKEYRNFTCQFCSEKLPIRDSKFYIEACHIKPKAKGGKDVLDNILVLCPNCHKIFDYSERKNEKWKDNQYEVTLNDTSYTVATS